MGYNVGRDGWKEFKIYKVKQNLYKKKNVQRFKIPYGQIEWNMAYYLKNLWILKIIIFCDLWLWVNNRKFEFSHNRYE